MSEKERPFSNSFQYLDWRNQNCDRCSFDYYAAGEIQCAIEAALSHAAVDDGTVPAEIAERMGYTDPLAYVWDCPERELREVTV